MFGLTVHQASPVIKTGDSIEPMVFFQVVPEVIRHCVRICGFRSTQLISARTKRRYILVIMRIIFGFTFLHIFFSSGHAIGLKYPVFDVLQQIPYKIPEIPALRRQTVIDPKPSAEIPVCTAILLPIPGAKPTAGPRILTVRPRELE